MSRSLRSSLAKGFILCAILSLLILASPLIVALEMNETNVSTKNQIEVKDEFDVHVYVNNQDDDRLEVTFLVDSELKETTDVSSKSETKLGEYALMPGEHSFKLSWRDEDTKKSYEEEIVQQINSSTSIILYTTKNDAPEKYEVSVKVENENDKSLDAYLYVDDNLEKSKEVPKDSTADFGEISLEEGIHDLCLRWSDPETKIEYEKSKKVNVKGDDAVIFYAPKGVTFESKEEKAIGSSSLKTKASSSDNSVSADKGELDSKTENEAKNSSQKNTASNETSTTKITRTAEVSNAMSKGMKLPEDKSKDSSSEWSSPFEINDSLYLYAALVLMAIYLLFKH
jgi:hypothetical protein